MSDVRTRPVVVLALVLLIGAAVPARAAGNAPGLYWCLVEDSVTQRVYHSDVRALSPDAGLSRIRITERFVQAASGTSGTMFATQADTCHWFRTRLLAWQALRIRVADAVARGFVAQTVAVF